MNITLDQKEIESAIVDFIGKEGVPLSGKSIKVAITAGRGPNGLSAAITITKATGKGKVTDAEPPFIEPTTEVSDNESTSESREDPVTDDPSSDEEVTPDEEKPLFGGG